MKSYLTISEAAEYLSVCTKTLRRWDKAGKLNCFRTSGGHRRIATIEIERLVQGAPEGLQTQTTAIYTRVSSHEQKQKGDLERQVQAVEQYCLQQGYQDIQVFQDVASGLNTERRGLQQLCRFIECGKIKRVVITYKDRLTRFGFEYLTRYFQSHGTEVEVLYHDKETTAEKELVEDLVAIVTAFSGRVHELRSHKTNKRIKDLIVPAHDSLTSQQQLV